MTNDRIIAAVLEEIERKPLATTAQYLSIHRLIYSEHKPVIARLDIRREDGTAIAYLPIEGEKFYLTVYLDTQPSVKVRAVRAEAFYRVYFRATSDEQNYEALAAMTSLKPTSGWSKGENRNFSAIEFLSNPEPDTFENKIEKLLCFLEQDAVGIKQLVECANGVIQVAANFHNGNTMLGGFHLESGVIKRMSQLNLEIDFDLYAEGNFFES